jgi:hypothetical protein
LIDAGDQVPRFGVQPFQPAVLEPWPPADCVYSSSVSFLIRSLFLLTRKISLSVSLVRASISRMGRQWSNCCAEAFARDNNCRH